VASTAATAEPACPLFIFGVVRSKAAKSKKTCGFFAKKAAKKCLAAFGCGFSVTPDHKKRRFAAFATSSLIGKLLFSIENSDRPWTTRVTVETSERNQIRNKHGFRAGFVSQKQTSSCVRAFPRFAKRNEGSDRSVCFDIFA